MIALIPTALLGSTESEFRPCSIHIATVLGQCVVLGLACLDAPDLPWPRSVQESGPSSKQSRKRLFACAEIVALATDDGETSYRSNTDIVLVDIILVTC